MMATPRSEFPGRLELWAGAECTVNRIGDRYSDQLARTGHDARIGDLDLLAELGITTLRYPVLWERACPALGVEPDWQWTDARMERLRRLGLKPIAGLVHHGSGPRGTSLVEPSFASGLADYAGRVARRYPWIEAYTPVNEPLTTARFSGLYGHWYPHGTDERTFARALLNECRATVLAMRAIRRVNPSAQLIQTDDLGETHSTELLAYQADFENLRRWVTWDLLCGRIDRAHPLWGHFAWAGIPCDEVAWFLDNPCPPDVIGLNYYVTSERFLDERLEYYPGHTHGGNGRHAYADVEAIRALERGPLGIAALLRQAWRRYGLPLAITEAHLGCTREEQMRWLKQIWESASAVRREGIDVRAVTAWSAFGSCDWDSLATRESGHYEPGLFDARAVSPRPTGLARLAGQLATGRPADHPVLEGDGWWQRPERLYRTEPSTAGVPQKGRPILIVGANTALGRAFRFACAVRGLPVAARARRDLDASDPAAVAALLAESQPWAVIYTGASANVDWAEARPERCRRETLLIPRVLAQVCAEHRLPFVIFSSEHVFDGRARQPYRETDAVAPLNVYGSAHAEAEAAVLELDPSALVIRTGTLFGIRNRSDFVWNAISCLRQGLVVQAPLDLIGTPSYLPDAIGESLDLLIDGEGGIRHVGTKEPISLADLARRCAAVAGFDPARIEGRPATAFEFSAPRPTYTALTSRWGSLRATIESGLRSFLETSIAAA